MRKERKPESKVMMVYKQDFQKKKNTEYLQVKPGGGVELCKSGIKSKHMNEGYTCWFGIEATQI